MSALVPVSQRHDGQLWLSALGLSLLVNLGLLFWIGIHELANRSIISPQVPAPPEQFITIFPEIAAPAIELPAKRFARTSADQTAEKPATPTFQGERNTQATSDRPPDRNAPALPSQAGATPLNDADFETTESDYREGKAESQSASATPAAAAQNPSSTELAALPPPQEKLLDGPNPVEIPVPKPAEIAQAPAAEKPALPQPKPKPAIADPAFSGFQRKAAIQGSISRTGRSSLDVEDSPLGHYQAIISRAVEQEWQRNCVRHRDFITPGFLTVRFFVEPSGRVKTVQFVGEMETGEVQKGFTLNAIRDAEIPAMPAALKKEYAKEPLELIFNFYF